MSLLQVKNNNTIIQKIFLILAVVFVVSYSVPSFAQTAEDYLYSDGVEMTVKSQTDLVKMIFGSCGYPEDEVKFVCGLEKVCWFCGPYAKVIEVMQKVANKTYENVTPGMLSLLAVCFAIWLVIIIIKYIAVAKLRDVGGFYNDIGKATVRVLLASVVLGAGATLWDYTVSPLADGVFDYGTASMGTTKMTDCNEPAKLPDDMFASNQNEKEEEKDNPVSIVGEKIIGDQTGAGGIIASFNQRLMSIFARGVIMMTAAMADSALCVPTNHLGLFLAGLGLVVFSVWLLLFIPLKLADIIFRLGLFLMLMPLFVFAWVFPISRDFTQKGINMLANVMVSLLLFAIMIGLCTELLMTALELPPIASGSAGVSTNVKTLTEKYVTELENFVIAATIVLFSVLIFGQIPDIAGRLTDSVYNSSGFERGVKSTVKNTASGAAAFGSAVLTFGKSAAFAASRVAGAAKTMINKNR